MKIAMGMAALASMLLLAVWGQVHAVELVVNPAGGGDYLNLATAWDSCGTGDTLSIATGTYDLSTYPDMMKLMPAEDLPGFGKGKAVHIRSVSGDPDDVVIDGEYSASAANSYFVVCAPFSWGAHAADLTIENITIKNMTVGVSSCVGHNLTVLGCKFVSIYGPAIKWEPGRTEEDVKLLVRSCESTRDLSTRLGGHYEIVVADPVEVEIDSCLIQGATKGIWISGAVKQGEKKSVVEVAHTTFDSVDAAVFIDHVASKSWDANALRSCTFTDCGSSLSSSKSAVELVSSTLLMDTCTFTDCVAYEGGVAQVVQDANKGVKSGIRAESCTVDTCSARRHGGAFSIGYGSTLEMQNCTVTTATTTSSNYDGGAVYMYEGTSLSLVSSSFLLCDTAGDGGAVYLNRNVKASITGCDFMGNQATNGGAVYLGSTLEKCANSIFTGNDATAKGGALYLEASQNLLNCTVSYNGSVSGGGGLYIGPRLLVVLAKTIVRTNTDDGSSSNNAYIRKSCEVAFECCNVTQSGVTNNEGSALEFVSCVDVDPEFCSNPSPPTAPTEDGEFLLQNDSPMINVAGCGLVGGKVKAETCP